MGEAAPTCLAPSVIGSILRLPAEHIHSSTTFCEFSTSGSASAFSAPTGTNFFSADTLLFRALSLDHKSSFARNLKNYIKDLPPWKAWRMFLNYFYYLPLTIYQLKLILQASHKTKPHPCDIECGKENKENGVAIF